MGRAVRTPSPLLAGIFSSDESTSRSLADVGLEPFNSSFMNHDALAGFDSHFNTLVPRPRTPPPKRVRTDWHGLPSPQTPSCAAENSVFQSRDSRSDGHCSSSKDSLRSAEQEGRVHWPGTTESAISGLNTLVSPSTTDANFYSSSRELGAIFKRSSLTLFEVDAVDAESALELSTHSSVRRSIRLRHKTKAQSELIQVPAVLANAHETTEEIKSIPKPSKRATRAPTIPLRELSRQVLTSAKPSDSSFEVALTPGAELPALHSTEWQLMYPPGGSSHPSYPWPAADSRLVFHPHHVPLRNGLPDISCVPVLVLPLEWRQVCWSGLNPVVFDPFRQAFKLTPVGPLPLTCEEVHQGGLQDYVPGGKFHPEFGLLPQLSSLSDGSDHAIFNFEGVDWVLPWSHVEGAFEITSSPTSKFFGTGIEQSAALASLVTQPESHCMEARDCPDHVIDLEDGWRWLKMLASDGTAAFKPSPGKSWRGTGITLASRKTKQPIANLMALTMTDKEAGVEYYLAKQDRREFCSFKSVATPVHVDITLLRHVEFTIMELLCYFPSHYQWRGGANRLARAGMVASDIANIINMVRCLPPASICKTSTVDAYISWDRQEDGSRIRVEPSDVEAIDYTAEHWSSLIWEAQDYPFLAIAHGLKELPSGRDAGSVTALVKWCRETDRTQVMLSDVVALLKEANIESLIDPGNGVDPDKEFLSRHAEAVKVDRKRVIQEKKDLDAHKEKRFRKRKLD